MNFEVYDVEAFRELFCYVGHSMIRNKRVSFEISRFSNNLYPFVNHLRESSIDYHTGYNNVNYDGQIIQFILDNYEKWVNLSPLEICLRIKQFSNEVIERSHYEMRPYYYNFDLPQCDIFKIHHFDNDARKTGLKWCEFSIDFENVEECPVPFDKENLTREDILEIVKYCHNDVSATVELFKFTRGETENEIYKGKDKVADRIAVMDEYKFPIQCMSWSDVKIGDEINKKVYKDLSKRTDKEIYDAKRNRKPRSSFTFKQCIPSYIEFVTPEFQAFFEMMKKEKVRLGGDVESKKKVKKGFPFTYNNTTYIIAQGGIHSNEKNRIIIPKSTECLMDADVGSQYPHAIIKRRLYPSHLGEYWLVGFKKNRDERLFKKAWAKKELDQGLKKRAEGVADMLKLALNGGGFGMLNMRESWQYDPFCAFSCTIGNQFEILMLVESMELNNIHVISANTDGIVCLFDRSLLSKYNELCTAWEIKVGNSEQGKLEFTEYSKMYQSSVNDYIAINADPKETDPKKKIKKKGDFVTDVELHKNKSRRIIPIAMERYLLKNIPVETTVMSHRNIFDFCIGAKASKDYHYESYDRNGNAEVYHRMIRYYVSKDGRKLKKIKNEGSEADGNDVSDTEAGAWLCTIANQIDNGDDIRSYHINTTYYINKCLERIKLLHGGKKKDPLPNKEQLKMF